MTGATGMPDLEAVKAYLQDAGLADTWADSAVLSALVAETASQLKRCVIPVAPDTDVPTYTADLVEALCARVARRLALRPLPLGIQVTMSDVNAAQTSVGGLDREIKRLEGPYRKWVLG